MPGTFQPGYATNDPGVLYPPGTPGTFAPSPTISPYGMGNYAQNQTYNQRGLWFNNILNKRRDYYFGVDVLSVTGRSPGKGLIGAPTMSLDPLTRGLEGAPMNTYGEAAYLTPGTTIGQPQSRLYVDDGVIPFASLFEDGDTTPVAIINSEIFPIRSLQMFREFRSAGLQINGGYWNEDGSGLRASGWWGFEETQTFQRGQDSINGVVINQAIIINQGGQILFAKNGAVSFDTGIQVDILPGEDIGISGGTVGTQKYDVMYRASVSSEVGGGDVQMYLPDIGSPGSAIRLRPVYGAKYMFLGETFSFRGIDSGMSYTLDGEDTINNQTTFRPEPFDIDSVTINENLFETQVNSRTRSHLAGALAGLRYDFGRSNNFKLWGQSSVGAMANHEEVRVFGFNAGETVVTRFLTGTNMLDGDSSFSDTQRHTHVSPVFEQTFMSESKILAALPLVREVPILANANFKLGYTHTIIGNVARPGNSIQWNGFPKYPKVDIDYRNYYVGRTNVGLEWTY